MTLLLNGFLLVEAAEVGRFLYPDQVLFFNFCYFDLYPLWRVVGMKVLDAFSGGFELVFEDFY